MKKRNIILLILSLWVFTPLWSQDNCKVLVPKLQGQYTGKCKKGLAHGKGIAVGLEKYEGQFKQGLPDGNGSWTYLDGSQYTGQFKKGKKEGKGTLITKANMSDSVLKGYWHKDNYVGTTSFKPYIITRNYSIERYTLNQLNEKGNSIDIKLLSNGARNESVENLQLWGDSGFEMTGFNRYGFEQIKFPFKCKISYKTWNKLRTTRLDCFFEFEIKEPGHWEISLYN